MATRGISQHQQDKVDDALRHLDQGILTTEETRDFIFEVLDVSVVVASPPAGMCGVDGCSYMWHVDGPHSWAGAADPDLRATMGPWGR